MTKMTHNPWSFAGFNDSTHYIIAFWGQMYSIAITNENLSIKIRDSLNRHRSLLFNTEKDTKSQHLHCITELTNIHKDIWNC